MANEQNIAGEAGPALNERVLQHSDHYVDCVERAGTEITMSAMPSLGCATTPCIYHG